MEPNPITFIQEEQNLVHIIHKFHRLPGRYTAKKVCTWPISAFASVYPSGRFILVTFTFKSDFVSFDNREPEMQIFK